MQMRSIVNMLTLCDNRGTKFRERRMRLTKGCVLGDVWLCFSQWISRARNKPRGLKRQKKISLTLVQIRIS
jgi:hypothetical protein